LISLIYMRTRAARTLDSKLRKFRDPWRVLLISMSGIGRLQLLVHIYAYMPASTYAYLSRHVHVLSARKQTSSLTTGVSVSWVDVITTTLTCWGGTVSSASDMADSPWPYTCAGRRSENIQQGEGPPADLWRNRINERKAACGHVHVRFKEVQRSQTPRFRQLSQHVTTLAAGSHVSRSCNTERRPGSLVATATCKVSRGYTEVNCHLALSDWSAQRV
jgi:hypothetical protein